MPEVLLVEDDSNESGLACIAIALRRPGVSVHEASDLQQALALLQGDASPRVVILGWRALKDAARLPTGRFAFVGFASNLTQADKRRALDCGVRAIYERPTDWRPYCDALEELLDQWLGAKQDA